MAPPLLSLQGVALTFGGTPLLESADLSVGAGERVCLVGRNGSGKSTLLRIAAGLVEADNGRRFAQPGATIRYLAQEPDMSGHSSVLDWVEAGLGPGDEPYAARYLLNELGLAGDERPAELSGGEARRAALARTLAPDPDILLLDEPTNHLDLATIEWLEADLKARRAALVMISHDRRFLETLSRATVWLDRGRTRRIERGFASFETWREEVLAEEEAERHKLDRKLVAEEDWLRYGVTARRKRNVRRLAALQDLRQSRREDRGAAGDVRMAAAEAGSSGTLVIEAKGLDKAYGERVIVAGFSTRIHRGDRIGIVGPNGAGKTTLVRLLIGDLEADAGTVRRGAGIEMAALEQHRDSLDPDETLAAALTGGRGDTVMVGGQARHVVGYLGDFLFSPEQVRTPLRVLSGGERARVMLARALAKPSNLLVLDEPTNDLDLDTLDVLEEMLGNYAGTVLLISHDRDFLDRIASSVIVPEGGGRWREYAGGYTDMLAQRGADVVRAPAAGARGKPPERAVPQPARPGAADRRRLSFHQQHALKTLPQRIASLTSEIAALQARLATPDLFSRDRTGFKTASAALARQGAALEAAETEWLELEILREEIEGSPGIGPSPNVPLTLGDAAPTTMTARAGEAIMYKAVTRGIRVTVEPRYVEEESQPDRGKYFFAYTVEITNLTTDRVQLDSRHWRIIDGDGKLQEVKGAGVVGKQPVLGPGETFTYTSGCPLTTPDGTMQGTYTMVSSSGETFRAEIPAFSLDSPFIKRVVH